MQSKLQALGVALALFMVPSPAAAQDEAFTTGAGRLVVEAGDPIAIVSEDLYVSRQAVRVRYVFRNRTANDVTLPVSFPLPDRTATRDTRELRWPADFRTAVDGVPVVLAPRRRALLGSQDHSDLLAGLNVPISHLDAGFEPVQRALAALPRDQQRRLATLGLVEIFEPEGGPPQLTPLWTVRESWQWEQVFPAGRDLVVEHSYTPGLAGAINVGMSSDAIRNSEYGQDQIRRYCLDDAFLAGVDRLAAADPQGELPSIAESWFAFHHGTGPAVGEFRLVVDRGDAAALAGFCGEGRTEIGPTQVELRRTNWRPEGALQVLFLAPETAN